MSSPRVLISSISSKVPMIRAVREGFTLFDTRACILGGDSDPNCIGQNFVDDFIKMSRLDITNPHELIIQLSEHKITHLIPSRDGELSFYAEHITDFLSAGIAIMVADPNAIRVSADKLLFFQQHSKEFPVIETSLEPNASFERWVVKERFGSASSGIVLDSSYDDALDAKKSFQKPIFQPYIAGLEYSIDLYISKTHECLGHVVRSRDIVMNGESKVTTSRDRVDIAELAKQLVLSIGLRGHCLVQIIEDAAGKLHIVEVNPRYGGASGLSVALGLNSFYWFALETANQLKPEHRLSGYTANKKLIKYTSELVL